MALEDYTLIDIRARVRDEFGLESSTAVNAVVDDKINDAQAHIVSRKPNWPWMRKRFVIDVGPPVSGTIDFTQDSRTASNPVTIVPVARDILTTEEAGKRPTQGYLVEVFSSPNATLDAAWKAATEATKVVRQVQGLFQLPDDFLRLDGVPILVGNVGPDIARMIYLPPADFQIRRYQQLVAVLNTQFYTVERDPLDLEERKYMLVYPYLADRYTIRLKYWRDLPKLVNDADVPVVPRTDRLTLLTTAYGLMAQQQGEEDFQVYQQRAQQLVEQMAVQYELVDDTQDMDNAPVLRDWVAPPSAYEDF